MANQDAVPQSPTEPTDREVDARIASCLGWTGVKQLDSTLSSWRSWVGNPPEGESWNYIPNYTGKEGLFVNRVITALDARGLGEKYVETLASMLPNFGPAWFNSEVWRIASASLSLRARAALTVLENAKP